MNKQELEKQAEALYTDVRSFLDNTFELIDHIDQPQRVVVPKVVALRIEKYKDSNKSLYQLLDLSDDKEFNDWFSPNGEVDASRCDVLARAWLDGYEIEQGKLYVVTDGNKLYLKEFDELNAIIIIDVVGAVDYAKRYEDKTKAQQAADELGWIVQEVE
ncbi:DUF1642 domain-containing protein [Streptococcus suis]|uniref:DUF1642 domain-containing protein n=1 Tax=Streptococcus suis TaxID=1307 RepID=UPI0009AA5E2E|nr:DUF1642 domain-containing protein [Streptococcus suis]MDW8671946.1 DUF1642 domain-containing protein [Streptococcus suis]